MYPASLLPSGFQGWAGKPEPARQCSSLKIGPSGIGETYRHSIRKTQRCFLRELKCSRLGKAYLPGICATKCLFSRETPRRYRSETRLHSIRKTWRCFLRESDGYLIGEIHHPGASETKCSFICEIRRGPG